MKPTQQTYGARKGALGALAAVALLLAGCGGSSNTGVANLANSSGSSAASASARTGEGAASPGSSSPEAEALANAGCMRSHGVPNFPDPTTSGVVHLRGVDLSSPAFQAAQRACRKLFPNGAKGKGGPPSPAEQARMQESALKFSQCMRSHGVPNFPDPPAGSGPKIEIEKGSGIDPNSPQFQAAQKTCQSNLPRPPGGKGGGGPEFRGNAVRIP
ncbi:MAG: hypothetical protein ACRDK2_12495 [Solirubrobacteraceae bacterium]